MHLWHALPRPATDTRYCLVILKRIRMAGKLVRPGQSLLIPESRLRVAAHFCKTGAARPADKRTALDVALLHELQATAPTP